MHQKGGGAISVVRSGALHHAREGDVGKRDMDGKPTFDDGEP